MSLSSFNDINFYYFLMTREYYVLGYIERMEYKYPSSLVVVNSGIGSGDMYFHSLCSVSANWY